MDPRKLITTLAAFALLAGAGVAGALASSPAQAPAGTSTATIACDDQGEQGENEEADAATEVEQAATEVDQEAASEQADDQEGDDQPGEQGDEQGENEDCGD